MIILLNSTKLFILSISISIPNIVSIEKIISFFKDCYHGHEVLTNSGKNRFQKWQVVMLLSVYLNGL